MVKAAASPPFVHSKRNLLSPKHALISEEHILKKGDSMLYTGDHKDLLKNVRNDGKFYTLENIHENDQMVHHFLKKDVPLQEC